MFSTPPAMKTSPSPALIACAALAAAWSPEPHSRFTVWPGTSTGRPARSRAIRATLRLSSPAWFVHPRITSSMDVGSIPERSTTALIGIAARSSARTDASAPPCFPTGVRSAAQMYASRSTIPPSTALYRPLPASQTNPHRLRLRIVVERFFAQVPPEPRELVASERRRRIVEVVGVHPHRPRLDRPGDAVGFLDVPRPDARREPVHRAVGERDAGVLAVEREHGEHRPEDLLVHDLHPGLRRVEHGGLDVVALAVHLGGLPAGDEARPFRLPGADVGQHLLLLALRHDRAEPGVLVERVPGDELLRPLGELLDHLVVDRFFYQEPRPGGADLALAVEDPRLGAAHRRGEVRVGEDDVGALPAELERHAFHRPRRLAHDPLAHFGRTGERDLVHERVPHERRPGGRAGPGHDVQRFYRSGPVDHARGGG